MQIKLKLSRPIKNLIIDELQNIDLESYDFGYGEADEEAYEAVEALVLEKTGQAYDKDDGIPKLEPDGIYLSSPNTSKSCIINCWKLMTRKKTM